MVLYITSRYIFLGFYCSKCVPQLSQKDRRSDWTRVPFVISWGTLQLLGSRYLSEWFSKATDNVLTFIRHEFGCIRKTTIFSEEILLVTELTNFRIKRLCLNFRVVSTCWNGHCKSFNIWMTNGWFTDVFKEIAHHTAILSEIFFFVFILSHYTQFEWTVCMFQI